MLFESDLFLTLKLFFPDPPVVLVFDPQKSVVKNYESNFVYVKTREEVNQLSKIKKRVVIINLSGAGTFTYPINFDLVDGIISFSKNPETSTEFYHHSVYFIQDQTNAIKWLVSENHKNTEFLTDYYSYVSAIDISNISLTVKSFIGYLRVKWGYLKKLTDGTIQILKRENNLFKLASSNNYESFITHLQDAYLSGIINVNLFKNDRQVFLYRQAINKTSYEKLEEEKITIDELQNQNPQNFQLLAIENDNGSSLQSIPQGLKKSEYYKTEGMQRNSILSAVLEYYSFFQIQKTVREFLKDEDVFKLLSLADLKIKQKNIPNGLSFINLTRLAARLLEFLNNINLDELIKCSLVNNGLIPENIWYFREQIYLVNWGDSVYDFPVFYDLFEYEFRHFEELKTNNTLKLLNDLNLLKNTKKIFEFVENNNLDFDLYLKLYLIHKITKELNTILAKKIIKPETSLRLYLWLEFLDKYDFKTNHK
jgi:hypothetical protein